MNVIELMRVAQSRREAIAHYDRLADRFDRMEQRFLALRRFESAEDAREVGEMVARAQAAERDNPEPREPEPSE